MGDRVHPLCPKNHAMTNRKVRNMEEFAAVSGISRPTVSKYFHDPDSVRPTTRARIEAALEQYDFRPNIYAINQNRRLTKNIGIMVPYLADPFFAEIARVIETLCIAAGFRPILLSSHGERQLENDNLDSLMSLKPAGVLLAPLGRASDRSAIERFCDTVPTVLFDSKHRGYGRGIHRVGQCQFRRPDRRLPVPQRCAALLFRDASARPNPNANKRRGGLSRGDGAAWRNAQGRQRRRRRLGIRGEIGRQGGACGHFGRGFQHRYGLVAATTGLPSGFWRPATSGGCAWAEAATARSASHPMTITRSRASPARRSRRPAHDYLTVAGRAVDTLFELIESGGAFPERREELFPGASGGANLGLGS